MCMGLGEIEGVAVFVEDLPGQEKRTSDVGLAGSSNGVLGQEVPDCLPRIQLDYGVVLSGIGLAFVRDASDVNGVGQELVEIAPRERLPACPFAGLVDPPAW